ncbi:MAG: hypothetical protein ACYTGL_23100 [Planctomycetota bacterium]|jgi:hypothetical protein
MIRPITFKESLSVDGSQSELNLLVIRTEVSDYLYLVADCLTVVFHESDELGLSEFALVETANRYLDEARSSLVPVASYLGGVSVPDPLWSRDEIPDAATELSVHARALEEAGFSGMAD